MLRKLAVLLAIASGLMQIQTARAEYPSEPIHFIVPVAAGGGVDVMARLIAAKLSERLGQQVIVENKPGAAGVIGTRFVTGSAPDGYTLLFTPSSLAITVAVHKTLPYDVNKDLTPIINVSISPYALIVHNSVPAHNLAEFIAYAKANPGKLNFSSAGVGSASHLAAELFKTMAGVDMVHIPNKGMNPALVDLIGGQVQVLFGSVPALLSENSERVHPIAGAELKRSALMPNLPTIDESGLRGYEVGNWAGLLGPANLDPKIVKKLHDEIVQILDLPDVKERFTTLGFEKIASTPEEFGKQVRHDVERWTEVVKRAKIPVK